MFLSLLSAHVILLNYQQISHRRPQNIQIPPPGGNRAAIPGNLTDTRRVGKNQRAGRNPSDASPVFDPAAQANNDR